MHTKHCAQLKQAGQGVVAAATLVVKLHSTKTESATACNIEWLSMHVIL
jgi:hypothetical protein